MTIPLLYWLIFGGVGSAVANEVFNSTKAREPSRITSARKFGLASVSGLQSVQAGQKTGPLPAAAMAAWNAPKHGKRRKRSAYGPANDIHKRGSWLRFATYSKNWDQKLEKMRIYSDPPGTLFVKSTSKVRNLCWMMQAPANMYPGYGKAARRNVRWDALHQWISLKADWGTIKGALKTTIKNIPDVVQGAAVVTAAIFTFGGSAAVETGKQVETVADAIKGALEPIGDTGKSVKKRKKAARAVYSIVADAYIQQVMRENRHAVKEGKLDIGPHYMANPQTWEDLRRPGKSHPLLYIPA